MEPHNLRNKLFVAAGLFVLVVLAAGAAFALSTWGEVNRVDIDRDGLASSGPVAGPEPSGEEGAEAEEPEPDEAGDETEREEPSHDAETQVFLLVGSDSRADLENPELFGLFEGRRADVVMVLIKTPERAGLLSLPRDLLVRNACTGDQGRLGDLLEGCGTAFNGPSLLTYTVENLIGEDVDHFALVDLAGFQAAVDAVGGYEICLEHPVRDERANLSLPAGCTLADGEDTLAWLRSRRTEELRDGAWQRMAGVNDLVRNERQRAFLIDMMSSIGDFSSPQALAGTARSVAPYVTVDSDLSLMSAVNLAWTMRGLGAGDVVEMGVPVYDDVTSDGLAVLRSSVPVADLVAEFLAPETADTQGTAAG